MANQLKVNQQEAILALKKQGCSQREVARQLGLHRNTVQRYWDSQPPTEGSCSFKMYHFARRENGAKIRGRTA